MTILPKARVSRGERLSVWRLRAVLAGAAALLAWAVLVWKQPTPTRVDLPVPVPTADPSTSPLARLEVQAAFAPKNPELALHLGGAYAEANRYAEALAQFQRATRLEPGLVPARVGQGQMWMKLQRPGRAAEALEWAAQRLPDSAEVRLELGAAYLALRDQNAMLRHLLKAAELAPYDPEVQRALACGFNETSSYSRAAAAAQKAIDLEPGNAENWTLLGGILLTAGTHADAERELRRALKIKPDHVTANVYLARVLTATRTQSAAAAEIQALLCRALTADPFNAQALHLLGRHYLEQEKLDLAVSTLRRAREADPRSHRVTLLLGQALVRRGDKAEGRELVFQAQEQTDKIVDFRGLEFQAARNPNPNVHLRLAELYMRQGYYDSAVHVLQKARRLAPGDPKIRAELQRARRLADRGSPPAPTRG